MSEEVRVEKSSLSLERIALTAVVALLSWNVYTTSQLVTDLAITNTRIESMKEVVSLFTQDRYTAAEAAADKALYEQRLDRLETWNDNLSKRLADVESTIRQSGSTR